MYPIEIELRDICKSYPVSGERVMVLDHINLTVQKGEFLAIMGPSGAGKSTLMNLIGTMDTPDAGRCILSGVDLSALSHSDLARFRSEKIGFIFQNFNLIPSLTALENVCLPLIYRHIPRKERQQRAEKALKQVGLLHRMQHLPGQLSGGQCQRTAIARVLASDPEIILADEPTGALDAASGTAVMTALRNLHQAGKTILLITHDSNVAACADRVLRLSP